MFAYYKSFPYLCETIADKTQITMKHTPVKYELVELINDPLDSNSGHHTKKDYYRIFTEGQNYYDFSTGDGFNITGHISEQNVKLLASAPALESQVKELREAGNALIEAMNQYSFFADGYRKGSASISEVQHANDQQNEAYSKMFDVLKSLNKQP